MCTTSNFINRGLRGQYVNVHHVNNEEKLIAFHRWAEGGVRDDVVVVANFADRVYDNYTIGFPTAGLWKLRFNSDSKLYSAAFGDHFAHDTQAQWGARDGMPCLGNVGIGAYTLLVYSQE